MIETLVSPQAWLLASLIFFLRVANMSLDTLRMLVVMRGRKLGAWILGFAQTVIYVFVLTSVIQDLTNVLNIAAYAGGFATGNVLGMWVEDRMALGHVHIRVISAKRGSAVAEHLRQAGFAVTELAGRGRDGAVTVLTVSVLRKNARQVRSLVEEIDPEAFITGEDLRPILRGFWRP